jgi:CarboxypepD_reg-like domain
MIVALCFALAVLASDPTGTITGHVVEARTGAPLVAVLVKVQSTGQQALSGADGQFEIANVPAGPQTLLVSVVGYGLVHRDVSVAPDQSIDVTIPVAEGASGYVEEVTVGASRFRQVESGVSSQQVLGSRDLLALRGVIADDPFRAVQVMPTVATGDDFQAQFAVRGQGPAHIGVALDGVDSPLLFHTVRGVEDTGSLALINSDILDSATLLAGAYPQRLGAHVGARLDFTTRDPARDRLTARMLVSGTAATTVWEGPLGTGSRGGWMVAARKSYIDWLLRKIDPTIEGTFGFSDGQAKVAFSASPHHALQASVVAGRSLLHEQDETPSLNALDEGHNSTVIGTLRWQYTPSARFALTQQAYIVEGRYKNTVTDGRSREEGLDRDITWRANASFAISPPSSDGSGHFLEAGGQSQRQRGERLDRTYTLRGSVTTVDGHGSSTAQSAWLNYRWLPSPSIVIAPGLRVERFGIVDEVKTSPWVLAEWRVSSLTKLRASGGMAHQAPTFDQTLRPVAGITIPGGTPPPVGAEGAATFDVGVERRIRESWRLSVAGYYRQESDGLRYENADFRVDTGRANRLISPSVPVWANTLTGDARGAEVTIDRRVANGISGWISYAYGDAQMDDARTGETFAADYDQRHMVNAYAIYRTSDRLGMSARFRYGSNFPIQGYFEQVGDRYYIGGEKNTVRLPAYARLDLRADWAFTYRRSRLTLFVEVLNAFNRKNYGPSDWGLDFTNGTVIELLEKGFPFLPSAGVLIEF